MGKASGTSGRAVKMSRGTTDTDTSRKIVVGEMTDAQYAELQDLYDGISDEDLATFNNLVGEALNGVDLKGLDKKMRDELAGYGIHYAKATLDIRQAGDAKIKWKFFDKEGNEAGRMVRTFSPEYYGERMLVNELFKLNSKYQSTGLAKHLLAVQLDMAKKAGIDTIAVHANLDVGGYTWARMGFQPEKTEISHLWDRLNDRAMGTKDGYFYNKNTRETIARKYTAAERDRAAEAAGKLWAARLSQEGKGRKYIRIAHIVEKYSDVIKPAWLGANWYGHINLRDRRNYQDYYNYLHSGKIDNITQ